MHELHNGPWDFRFPTKIVVGVEAYAAVAAQVAGRRALLVCTEGFVRRGGGQKLAEALGNLLVGTVSGVTSNPDVEGIAALCRSSLAYEFEVIVAIGGGSVIDAAKVVAAGRGQWGDEASTIREFLAAGGKVTAPGGVSLISVPTTSGTGAEVTPFATVWDNQLHKKFSVDGPALYPEAAILDPALTVGLPEDQTISTGLDAVSQALESLWNKRANPMTSAIATQSLVHSLQALPRLVANLQDNEARHPMALGSLLAGVAISQTRTGIAHAISYPLTARFGVPHGIACSFTLPAILEHNMHHDDGRFLSLVASLGLKENAELLGKIRKLCEDCEVTKRLLADAKSPANVMSLQAEMFTPGRADNNFTAIDAGILEKILLHSL